ncbi:MAG: T9SS type A sorting domain-containing protein [Bacteroidota bacterium]
MKRLIFAFLFCAFTNFLSAQTNVSGGIYANTTWTLANSPYILTDTVVVFPGVTLSIEPGVTIKFDDGQRLEVRNGTLIAQGTNSQPITFTSNSSSPVAGSWDRVYLNQTTSGGIYTYCKFSYAKIGLLYVAAFLDTIHISNCNFDNNIKGISMGSGGYAFMDSSNFNHHDEACKLVCGKINHCSFMYDNYGVEGNEFCSITNSTARYCAEIAFTSIDSVINCVVKNCGTGISGAYTRYCDVDSCFTGIVAGDVSHCNIRHNTIGIGSSDVIKYNVIEFDSIGIYIESNCQNFPDSIYCNKICSNDAYGFMNECSFSKSVRNNYWCTTDSALVASYIYDGYDNVSSGLVSFMPIDTQQCYLNNIGTFIPVVKNTSITIYPNPATNEIKISNLSQSENQIKIFNLLGQQVKSIAISNEQNTTINISDLPIGLYELTIFDGEKISCKKLVKE